MSLAAELPHPPNLPNARGDLDGLTGVELALFWAGLGHRVLPVYGATKRPIIKAWQENCSTDEATIRGWWEMNPNARVGLATGAPGCDVVDFDVAGGKPGLAQMEKLIDSGVLEAGTFMVVSTPSGGRHLYFIGSEQRNRQNEKAVPGVDFRGVGGMVLAPGNPGYRIVGLPLQPLVPLDWGALAACLAPTDTPVPSPRPSPPQPPAPSTTTVNPNRLVAPSRGFDNAPGEESALDWYCSNHDFGKLLLADGWTFAYSDGQGRDYYTRPGKEVKDGTSGNVKVNADGRQTFINFSSTVAYLPTDRGMSAAQWYAHRHHGGNLTVAAREIRRTMMPQRERPNTIRPGGPGTTESSAAGMAAPPAAVVPPEGTGEANLPVRPEDAVREFWQARPELRDIWWRAQVGRVSPWAILGYVLAMVAVRVGPHVRMLTPDGNGEGSLNLLVALEGESGEGKQRAKGPAGRFVAGPAVPPRKPGTGQGIASLFAEGTKDGVVQTDDVAWLNETEITNMGAHTAMKGSNLVATLLAVFMGETLGEHYGDKAKRREVAEGAYRVALTVGVQPTNAGILLEHQGSGLSQRFLWVPALWPEAVLPEGPLKPPAPGPELPPWEPWPAILPASLDPECEGQSGWSPSTALASPKKNDGPEPVPVKPTILVRFAHSVAQEIDREDAKRQNRLKERRLAGQFGGDADSHGVLLRQTLAALMTIWLDHSLDVTPEIWELTSAPMLVSAQTRVRAEVGSRHEARQKSAARHRDVLALEEKKREAVDEAEARKEQAAKQSIRRAVLSRLEKTTNPEGWVSSADLARACDSRYKKTIGGVPGVRLLLATLADLGGIERQAANNNAGGDQWRLPR